jgi:hypothetical protein
MRLHDHALHHPALRFDQLRSTPVVKTDEIA